jgi:AAA domain-containing protein
MAEMNVKWIEEAIALVQGTCLQHPRFMTGSNELTLAIRAIGQGEVIPLVGPSRWGKTRMLRESIDAYLGARPDEAGKMPVVFVEAENSGPNGIFSTKDFMARCLEAIHHPFYGRDDEGLHSNNAGSYAPRHEQLIHRTPERTLRAAFESAMRNRGTQVLVIDEAHHVQYVAGGNEAAARVLDSWKCLANAAGVKLVLSGSYEILDLLILAPHLVGRQQTIHLSRYRSANECDVRAWAGALAHYSKIVRTDMERGLLSQGTLLLEGSLGCIGQLSRWLRQALVRAQLEDANLLTVEHLKASALPQSQYAALRREIESGESRLASHSSGELGPMPARPLASKSARRRPGTCKPRRHERDARGGDEAL